MTVQRFLFSASIQHNRNTGPIQQGDIRISIPDRNGTIGVDSPFAQKFYFIVWVVHGVNHAADPAVDDVEVVSLHNIEAIT